MSVETQKIKFTRDSESLLKIDHVSMRYGTKTILRDVNAQITNVERDGHDSTGQVICFLGPSVIGKTQLSRVIAGLQSPTEGRVTLQGDKPTGRGEVCMVPQFYPLFEYATVAKNLQIAGKQGGLNGSEINNKASVFIHSFGLSDYLDMYPRQLSGGTRQRVAIARQLMCASNYMVMDEPFSGLDPAMKRKATEAIITLRDFHTYNTIIVVTHDITEGLSVADTVWLMGLERDESGGFVEGARLVAEYDLASLGLAWRPDVTHDPLFMALVAEIRDRFQTLR